MTKTTRFLGVFAVAMACASVVRGDGPATFESAAKPFLKQHCLECHGPDSQEGEVAFHELAGINADNAELWKRVWEQVALGEMPPRDASSQPAGMERLRLADWITAELERAMRDKGGFQAHRHPVKGNHLNHDLLFGELPAGLTPGSSPARIWRLHPQEHLVRLNELINREPEYDPQRPGIRTHGDHIPWNEQGEVKVYYGLDRVIGWVGGSAAYAAAITGFSSPLSTIRDHGLQNYPHLYSVNGSEALQIARHAEDILRFMAYGPDAEPYQFADKVADIDEKYKHESLRGLAQSLFYKKEAMRPLTPVYDLMKEPGVSDERLRAAVDFLFESLTFRPPTPEESKTYLGLAQQSIKDLGKEDGAILGLVPIFLDRDALFRPELASYGTPDSHGRVMLQDWELALAIHSAFSYIAPDEPLKQAVQTGRLRTREDAQREVARILQDDSIRKPRLLQFFREYFDYERAGGVCKDTKALAAAGGDARKHYQVMFGMTANTDRLVELILEEDKNVLRELLTTQRVVIDDRKESLYFSEFEKLKKNSPQPNKKGRQVESQGGLATFPKGETINVRIAEVMRSTSSRRSLTTLPAEQRMGILTHPSWLVSHSDAMDNHAILRGRWIRERLLGDAVPDVPITVDAMLPDEPKETLRHRMRVTRESECWRCHRKMDPLGLPFEMYNHLGLYRTTEQGKPVDTSGEIVESGDPALDGPVENAVEMIRKLAESERVEQVFVRHAFRFWMGRNETLHDGPALQAAHRAYRDNGGSMKALLASLLSSDAFLYRKVENTAVASESR